MPPGRLATSLKPAFCRIAVACAERLPARHTATIGLSLGRSLALAASSPSGTRVAPRIVLLLLGDAGRGEAAIVVRRIEQAGLGQAEDAAAHRTVERARIALLEIGAARAADHDAVAGEGHALVVEHVGDAAVGVTGRRPHLERAAAERDPVAILQRAIGTGRAARLREGDLAFLALLQQPGAGHMVGMDMRLQR